MIDANSPRSRLATAQIWQVRPRLLLWAAGGLLVILAFLVASFMEFWPHTLDDAYISFTYARNLATGKGMVFNIDERVEGFSNPLLVFLLAALGWLGLPIPSVAKFIGSASALVAVISGATAVFLATSLLEMTPRAPTSSRKPSTARRSLHSAAASGFWTCIPGKKRRPVTWRSSAKVRNRDRPPRYRYRNWTPATASPNTWIAECSNTFFTPRAGCRGLDRRTCNGSDHSIPLHLFELAENILIHSGLPTLKGPILLFNLLL